MRSLSCAVCFFLLFAQPSHGVSLDMLMSQSCVLLPSAASCRGITYEVDDEEETALLQSFNAVGGRSPDMGIHEISEPLEDAMLLEDIDDRATAEQNAALATKHVMLKSKKSMKSLPRPSNQERPAVEELLEHGDGAEQQVVGAAESSWSNELSRLESEGFMDEPDAGWKMRKVRHEDQMRIQMETMTSCPNVFALERVCVPGCSSESKYNSSSFFACRDGVLASQSSKPRQFTTGLLSSLSVCSAPLVDPECSAATFWQTHYEPSFSCEFARRIGNAGEGGKWVCDPYRIADKAKAGKGCLVYSVGSNGQYDFEESVHESISPGCAIHTIDMNDWQFYGGEAPPEYVHYHKYEVGVPPKATPLSTIVQELGHAHKVIDLFKIDCEGCEWDTFRGWFGEDVHIQQVLVELHGTGSNDGQNAHDFFNFLFDLGYVVFNKEPNTLGCGGSCIEYAFIKLSPEFSRS